MKIQEFVPYLSVTDATSAVAFYSKIFDVAPRLLLKMPDDRVMHCEFRIDDVRFFVSEELPEHGGTPSPKSLGSTSVAIHLYVTDCDQFVEKMRINGAEILAKPEDLFWGERFARVRDPFGHEWGIATVLRDVSAEEIQSIATKMFEGIEG